jgi:glutamate decarboxylase
MQSANLCQPVPDASTSASTIIECIAPETLVQLLALRLEDEGHGKEGLVEILPRILKYSINTWQQGFMDKLFSSTNAVRNPFLFPVSNC